MATIWKRCVEWVTALRANLFTWARIKLTATYLLIIIFILAAYSTVLFVGLMRTIHNNDDLNPEQQHYYVEHTIDHIQELISTIDIVMFLFAAAGSYWLAGITLRPIRRSLEAQQAFSADASHELRTPLAVMKTSIEVLLRGSEPIPDAARQVLESNLEEIQFMSAMTNQLLELSRMHHIDEAAERIELHTLLENIVAKYALLAEQKHITLKPSLLEPATIHAHKGGVIRVIQNILTNAISYTPEHGTIAIAVSVAGAQATIVISDTGIGISEKDLVHVFERFYKADASRTGNDGSGLGLALAKQLVEEDHGQITIESKLGAGTAVTIIFPLA